MLFCLFECLFSLAVKQEVTSNIFYNEESVRRWGRNKKDKNKTPFSQFNFYQSTDKPSIVFIG